MVGVVGRLGTGKSTVAALLAGPDGALLKADEVSRALFAPGTKLWPLLQRAFPGCASRREIAARVFADPKALRRLQRITYPLLRRALRQRIAAAKSTDGQVSPREQEVPVRRPKSTDGQVSPREQEVPGRRPKPALVVVEAANLIELLPRGVIGAWVEVRAREAVALRRARRASGWDDATRRRCRDCQRQLPRPPRALVIANNGSRRDLARRVAAARARLLAGKG